MLLPMTVLEELDHIKDRRDKTVSREARIAINMIDKVVEAATPAQLQAGVDIPGSNLDGPLGKLSIYPDQLLSEESELPFLNDTQDQANDNRIINVALRLQAENPKSLSAEASVDLICSPNPHNVTLIYTCLMDFIGHVEEALKYEPG